jgi:hypothetical protein
MVDRRGAALGCVARTVDTPPSAVATRKTRDTERRLHPLHAVTLVAPQLTSQPFGARVPPTMAP